MIKQGQEFVESLRGFYLKLISALLAAPVQALQHAIIQPETNN